MNLFIRGVLLVGALWVSGCAVKLPLLPLMLAGHSATTNRVPASSAVPVYAE